MDNKLSELSKPVAWDFPGSKEESRQLGYDFELDDEQKVNCSALYSQEYVSALLAERDAFEASALAMRDEWRARGERIAELEQKERHNERQNVIDGLAGAGESWADIEEYMVKWDEARRNG